MTDPSSLLSVLEHLCATRNADADRFGDDLPYAHSVDDDMVDMEEQDEPIPFDDL